MHIGHDEKMCWYAKLRIFYELLVVARCQEQRLALCGCARRSVCVRHVAYFYSLYKKIAQPSKFIRGSVDSASSAQRAR
jgi:hypothetical protein